MTCSWLAGSLPPHQKQPAHVSLPPVDAATHMPKSTPLARNHFIAEELSASPSFCPTPAYPRPHCIGAKALLLELATWVPRPAGLQPLSVPTAGTPWADAPLNSSTPHQEPVPLPSASLTAPLPLIRVSASLTLDRDARPVCSDQLSTSYCAKSWYARPSRVPHLCATAAPLLPPAPVVCAVLARLPNSVSPW